MRYENNGIEIQYRECQILRDAAKELLADDGTAKDLVDQRDRWIQAIRNIAEVSEVKEKFAIPAAQFICGMGEEYLEAMAEYIVSLVIMVPFIASNKRLILPVNTHAFILERDSEAEETERD